MGMRHSLIRFPFILLICCLAAGIVAGSLVIAHELSPHKSANAPNQEKSVDQVLMAVELKLAAFSFLQKSEKPDSVNTNGVPVPDQSFSIQIPFNAHAAVSYGDMNDPEGTSATTDFAKAIPVINASFKDNGYKLRVPDQNGPEAGLLTIEYFDRSDSECQVTAYTVLDIYCDSVSDLDSIATEAEPLVTAYASAYPPSGPLSIQAPVISESKSAGYMIAAMSVSGDNGSTVLNFYQHIGGSWYVVNPSWYNDPHEDGSITPNCGYFDSLQQTSLAFKGISCFDTANRSYSVVGE